MQTAQENKARYWERVMFDDGCWPWVGPRNKRGYGHWKHGTKTRKATRIMWETFRGPIPAGLHVLHDCDNPCCVNIGHLFIGTHGDNMRDAASKGRLRYPLLRGDSHPSSKLNEASVRQIKALAATHSHAELGKMFAISRSVITRIMLGQLWAHVPSPA